MIAAQQGQVDILFMPEIVKDVETPTIRGRYTTLDALQRLLRGTRLVVIADPETQSYAIARAQDEADSGEAFTLEENNKENEPQYMMKQKNSILRKPISGLLSILFLGGSAALAQEPPRENEIAELSPFEVTGDSVIGYVSRESLSGSKAAERIIDTPAMINVVTTDFLDDTLSYDRVIDSLQVAVPGIKSIGPKQPNYLIRGLRSRDHGIDGMAQRGLNRIPMTFIESVEVLKGPSSLMYGSFADIGGYVNRNLKRPSSRSQGRVGAIIGTDDYKMAWLDTTGPVPGQEWIQYRFNAEYLDRGFSYNETDFRRASAYRLAVNFDFSESINLFVAAMNFKQDSRIDRAPLHPDTGGFVDFSVNEGADTISQNDDWLFQVDFTATPSESFSFNFKWHHERNKQADSFLRANPVYPAFAAEADAMGYNQATDGPYLFYRQGNRIVPNGLRPGQDVSDADRPNFGNNQVETKILWSYKPSRFPIESKLLLGGGFMLEQRDGDYFDTRPPGAAIVNYDPALATDTLTNGGGIFDIRNFAGAPVSYNSWWRMDSQETKGWLFYNERLVLFDDRLHLIYGQRWDYVENQRYRWGAANPSVPLTIAIPADELQTPQYSSGKRDFSNVSDRYGAIVKLIPEIALFFGYSESFQDQGPQLLTGGGLAPPLISEGRDIGIKADLFKGFSGTITFFNIDVTNRLTADPSNPGFNIIDRDVINNEGFEVSLAYQHKGLTLLFNYYDGKVIDTRNNRLDPSQILESWNSWAKYRFDSDSALTGLSLGLGVSGQGKTVGRGAVPDQPSATFLDGFVSYSWKDWIFRLAGSNMTDEFSVGNIITPLRVGYGRPKELKLSVEYLF